MIPQLFSNRITEGSLPSLPVTFHLVLTLSGGTRRLANVIGNWGHRAICSRTAQGYIQCFQRVCQHVIDCGCFETAVEHAVGAFGIAARAIVSQSVSSMRA